LCLTPSPKSESSWTQYGTKSSNPFLCVSAGRFPGIPVPGNRRRCRTMKIRNELGHWQYEMGRLDWTVKHESLWITTNQFFFILFFYKQKNDGELWSSLSYLSLEGIHEVWIHCHHVVNYMDEVQFIQQKLTLILFQNYLCVQPVDPYYNFTNVLLSPLCTKL